LNAKRVLALLHLFFAGLYLFFVLFAPWAKAGRDVDDFGVFSSDGAPVSGSSP
jgi:hypothetical protein